MGKTHGSGATGPVPRSALPSGPCTARWLALAPSLIAGYARESPLSTQERASLWSVLLVVQLLFAECYVSAQHEAGVRLNLAAFAWFADHGDEMGRHFLGTPNPTL